MSGTCEDGTFFHGELLHSLTRVPALEHSPVDILSIIADFAVGLGCFLHSQRGTCPLDYGAVTERMMTADVRGYVFWYECAHGFRMSASPGRDRAFEAHALYRLRPVAVSIDIFSDIVFARPSEATAFDVHVTVEASVCGHQWDAIVRQVPLHFEQHTKQCRFYFPVSASRGYRMFRLRDTVNPYNAVESLVIFTEVYGQTNI